LARKILLADDSVTAQNMGRKILADAGYEVIAVNNGSAALKRIAEQRPDLIVLDVYMPGYSGLEVCQRIKETGETSRIPILLTVGKLEPFKPEEAKRVRADGYIVKPFEASELLSALTKLEDKIVPVSEGSKPGRFARAIAAVEEGRYDKTMAGDEDAGWKSRINFPSKKKKDKAAEKDEADDSAIYNPVNKDLRTTVERKPTQKAPEEKPEENRVDLGALAPEGLPKDVTPEEIAALAAAAARVSGAIGETKMADPAPEQPLPSPSETANTQAGTSEIKTEAKIESQQTETKPEAAQEKPPTEPAKEVAASTLAGNELQQEKEEKEERKEITKLEPVAEKSAETSKEAIPVPTAADVAVALGALETSTASATSANPANGSPLLASEPHADEPVTMAVAAGAESASPAPRWAAVPISLAPEEAALSLEHEMQKAHAAFAAAEVAHAGLATIAASPSTAASQTPVEQPGSEAPTPLEPAREPAALAPSAPISTVEAAITAVASAATEAVTAAVKEFEKIAGSNVESSQSASAPVHFASNEETVTESSIVPAATSASEAPRPEAPKDETPRPEPSASTREVQERPEQELASQEPKRDEPIPAATESATTAAPDARASRDIDDMTRKESEMAANTAAAWASWRRVRGGDSKDEPSEKQIEEKEKPASADSAHAESPAPDTAAMAVAAGAEKAPEEPPAAESDSDSGELASIVDSVLADLRPKIVEEISRKMGKKK
jgi:CheY-like chemotaxis protein